MVSAMMQCATRPLEESNRRLIVGSIVAPKRYSKPPPPIVPVNVTSGNKVFADLVQDLEVMPCWI